MDLQKDMVVMLLSMLEGSFDLHIYIVHIQLPFILF